jgi:hypothetical protein
VGRKSPVEFQCAQETAGLTGDLGRFAVLKMGYSFYQRFGILGGRLVTEEEDLGCSEDAFRRVDEGPVPLKSVEENPYVARTPRETRKR